MNKELIEEFQKVQKRLMVERQQIQQITQTMNFKKIEVAKTEKMLEEICASKDCPKFNNFGKAYVVIDHTELVDDLRKKMKKLQNEERILGDSLKYAQKRIKGTEDRFSEVLKTIQAENEKLQKLEDDKKK
ncbi:hypothetical protein ADUPG1_008438 [Aduncisulcus paluster]|uniref:Prefoldin subunit 1 n=1 Tax=Aduncisulcus paluster TaxID=2918883 RepID=A0ABQ5KTA0_9EUKA|nr:hypothetical protein ADUPG1_008438 [Aduncisulcus paluster]|eukprot:gnl/Carplike_NY0171/2263_a3054_708.p1 GENE.gnl/Carplike_NY0171/2263_a3054_708~~gnl/Carplike_NY0171/2263_a3054_708.p1  ORF type:complete len:131 (-),score=34.70 gnl/Carplike_NY0171/2263_a3054_708:48-440(-)